MVLQNELIILYSIIGQLLTSADEGGRKSGGKTEGESTGRPLAIQKEKIQDETNKMTLVVVSVGRGSQEGCREREKKEGMKGDTVLEMDDSVRHSC